MTSGHSSPDPDGQNDHAALRTARRALVAKYVVLIVIGGLVVLALMALAGSWISYASVSRIIVGPAPDSNHLDRAADSLSQNFADIQFRLRVCAVGFLLTGGLATLCRRSFQIWIEQAVLPLPQFLGGVVRSLGRGLKADGKLNAWALLALCLLGVALRVGFLFRPVLLDEADSFIQFASRPLYIGLSWYPAPNNHLLNTLLMHVAWRWFGDAEWAIRLPTLVAGSLLIPVTYWAARVLYGKYSALIAASLVAASWPLINYSVNARGYMMLGVLALLLVITSHYLLKTDSKPAWLLWALIAALGFYTIPTMLYAVATAAVWLVLSSVGPESGPPRGQVLRRVASALARTAAITTGLYLPVLIVSGWRSLFLNSYVHSKGLAYLLAEVPIGVSETWAEWTDEVPPALVWILAAGFVLALVFHRRQTGRRVPVLLAAALCIPALVLVQRVVPPPRIWLFLLPWCAALAAAGLWVVLQRFANGDEARSRVSVAAALTCFLVMGWHYLDHTRFDQKSGVFAVEDSVVWMSGHLRAADVVVAKIGAAARLSYYFRRHRIRLVSHPAPCDPDARVYTSDGPFTGRPGPRERRVLAVAESWTHPDSALDAACLTAQTSSIPSLVYQGSVSVYESYVRAAVQ